MSPLARAAELVRQIDDRATIKIRFADGRWIVEAAVSHDALMPRIAIGRAFVLDDAIDVFVMKLERQAA